MKLKKTTSALFVIAISSLTSCGDTEIKFEVSVKDKDGSPLSNVECIVSMYQGKKEGGAGLAPYNVKATTNIDGIAILQGNTGYFNNTVVARKDEYYECRVDKMWITGREETRWEPWPIKVGFMLKKIVNPKPMYAIQPGTGMRFILPIDVDDPVGFDLLERDWLAPYGTGKHTDFLVKFTRDDANAQETFPKGHMEITFPNPGDGIIPAFDTAGGGSILISPHEAPESDYLNEARFSSHPHEDGIQPGLETMRRAWVIRVRSIVDDDGNIIRAKYGKIQNAPQVIFFSHGTAFRMTYYLNKDFDDRGLEWDQTNNLFEALPTRHWPKSP